jgi:hypothetical protein
LFRKQGVQVATPDAARPAIMELFPADGARLYAAAQENERAFQPPYPVLGTLGSHAARSRVDIVDFRGVPAVCKTFRRSASGFLRRELEARQLLAGLAEMTPVLEAGETYFVMPFYSDLWQWKDDGLRLFRGKFMRAATPSSMRIPALSCLMAGRCASPTLNTSFPSRRIRLSATVTT